MLSERKLRKLFERKDVAEICRTLRQHGVVDVNDCCVLTPHSARSVMSFAIYCFHPEVMRCLLHEFGADFHVVCVCGADDVDWYPLDIAHLYDLDPEKAMEWLLDHGTSPFVFLKGNNLIAPAYINSRVCLVDAAEERLYTAWAATWFLSQHPVSRDMAQQVAQCIMATPVREFLNESVEQNKKRRAHE